MNINQVYGKKILNKIYKKEKLKVKTSFHKIAR